MEDLYAYIDRWNLGGVSVIQKRKNKMNGIEIKLEYYVEDEPKTQIGTRYFQLVTRDNKNILEAITHCLENTPGTIVGIRVLSIEIDGSENYNGEAEAYKGLQGRIFGKGLSLIRHFAKNGGRLL